MTILSLALFGFCESPKKTFIDCLYLQKRTMNMDIRIMYVIMSMGCRTNGLSNQWAVEPMDCRTNGLSDHREVTIIRYTR